MLTLHLFVFLVLVAPNDADVSSNEFPYVLRVLVLFRHRCGGVMIKKDMALTAAACIRKVERVYLHVQAGSHIATGFTGSIVPVVQIHVLPDDSNIVYNVALLRMKYNFGLGYPIVMRPRGASIPTLERQFDLIGWRFTANTNDKYDQIYRLHRERMKYVESQDNWLNFRVDNLWTSKFSGNIGDPLVFKHQLVGITFIHDVEASWNSYQTTLVNISHPKIFDFITTTAKLDTKNTTVKIN